MTDPKAAEREAAVLEFMRGYYTGWTGDATDPECRALVALLATRERDAAAGALREAERLITAEHLEDPDKGSEYDLAYDHAVGDCLEAVSARRLALEQGTPATREETP